MSAARRLSIAKGEHGVQIDTVMSWRAEFPALREESPDGPFVYLDNAATTHRPRAVLDTMIDFYQRDNGNPGAGLHRLAERANERYEAARARVARFLDAEDPLEVVFTRGTTEAVNLIAHAWGDANLKPGDEIIISVAEHYSNLVPWQLAARRTGAVLRWLDIDDQGHLRIDELERLLSPRTKLVSFGHVSNVLGLINPARAISEWAHAVGARVFIDGAQSAPHMPVSVRQLGCDFFAFSAHKLTGPMGIGALWARREILEVMPPFHGGGDMAHSVTRETSRYAAGGLKFEAGTPNVGDAIGLAAALDFLETEVGFERLQAHEEALVQRLLGHLRALEGIRIVGPAESHDGEKISLVAFAVDGRDPIEVVHALDERGVGVRGGDLTALPLLRRLGLEGAVRASGYFYTTLDEVDRFAEALIDFRRSSG